MNKVRELIDSNPDWLSVLQNEYRIKANRDGSLVSLKYDQIESPMHEKIVQQCRGMVINVDTGQVMAHPYDKFWNHGEGHADHIDWSTARVQEKLDGSLMILWWHPVEQRWQVSSSGHPTAGGSFGYDSSRTFADAFWQAMNALNMKIPDESHRGYTFMLELCAKENRIVVKHDAVRLVVHGARDTINGLEVPRGALEQMAEDLNWEIVKEYPISTIDDCLAAAEKLDPLQTEGFVVVDAHGHRVKIKSPAYVALHHLRGEGMSEKRAVELWQCGETTEVLANFPEYEPEVTTVVNKIEAAIRDAYALWYDNASAPTRKDFAMAVKDKPGSSIAFKLMSMGKEASMDAATALVRSMHVVAIRRLIGSNVQEDV